MKYQLLSLYSCHCDLASGLWDYTAPGVTVTLPFMSMVAALFAYKAAFHFTLPFAHGAPATLAFSRLLQPAKLSPTTGPLYQLLPLPDLFQTCMASPLSFLFLLQCQVLRETY